jgi:hypothetical protein
MVAALHALPVRVSDPSPKVVRQRVPMCATSPSGRAHAFATARPCTTMRFSANGQSPHMQSINVSSTPAGSMDSVKQEVRFTDKHLGRLAEVIAGG